MGFVQLDKGKLRPHADQEEGTLQVCSPFPVSPLDGEELPPLSKRHLRWLGRSSVALWRPPADPTRGVYLPPHLGRP